MILAGVQYDERRLLGQAIRNMRPTKRPQMRWTMVREALGVCSTAAYAMCQEFKLNPEETVKP